jgi:hypothetical protein
MVLASAARAEEATVKAARGVLAKYQDALITVKLVVKMRGGSQENQLEVAGTVLTPAGLTVVSDFTSNPAALFLGSGEDKSETTDVKLVFRDAREVPAKFVLRDRELDLAFILPQEKQSGLPHVNLEKGPVPAPLDELVFLYRLGKSLNRDVAVTVGRVDAVVKKPRTFVVPDLLNGIQSLGSPVFDAAGRPVGVVVLRRSATAPRGVTGVRDVLDLMKPVVLIADDLQQAASQIAPSAEKAKESGDK